MKLLFVCPDWFPYSAGLSQSCLEMCEELQKQGHEIIIVVANDKGVQSKGMNIIPIKHFIRVMGRNPVPFFYWKQIKKHIRWADKICLFSYMYEMNSRILIYKKFCFFNKPILHFYRGSLEEEGVRFLSKHLQLAKKLWDSTLGKIMFTWSDKTISNSKPTIKYIHNKYGVPLKKLQYIPTAIQLQEFPKTNLRNKKIIFIGRLIENKGVHHFKEIVKVIPKDWKFTIVGTGPLENEINRLKNEYEQIEYLGRVPHTKLKEIIGNSDILILPTYAEGSPRAVLEASACGVPSIAFNVGDVPTVLPKKLTIPLGNINRFKKQLQLLIEDTTFRKEMSNEILNNIQPNNKEKVYTDINTIINEGQNARRKILHVIGALYQGGTEQQLENLLEGINKKTYQNKVISFYGEGEVGKRIEKNNEIIYFNKKITPSKISLQTILATIKSFLLLRKEIKKYRPDIIHASLPHANILSRFAAIGTKTKVISSIRVKEINYKGFNFIDRVSSSLSDLYITNSKTVKKYMLKHICKNEKKIRVVYNGTKEPKKTSQLQQIKKKLDVENKKIIIMVANFRKQKDHYTLFKAIELLSKKHDDFICLLAGEGELKKQLKRRVKELNIQNKIKFLGNVKNIQDMYSIADVSILSTHYEGTPNAIVESMLSNTPIIASKIPEIEEIITHKKEGLLFQPQNYKEATQYIEETLYSKKANNITYYAYIKAKKLFSINQMIASTEKIYEELSQ